MHNPYPHSRFASLIPGGIMDAIAGNAQDEPVPDTEFWSPQDAFRI